MTKFTQKNYWFTKYFQLKSLLFLVTLALFQPIFAVQNDSTALKVDSVLIFAEKTKSIQHSTLEKLSIDKKFSINNASLSSVLSQKASVYIKSYGNGQLASISLNGFNANQTNISWNGVQINNPMLHTSDLNLLKIGSNQKVEISMQNADNIAGNINLKHQAIFKPTHYLKTSLFFGSFIHSEGKLNYRYADKKIYNHTLISYQASQNNFKYKNPSLPPENNTLKQKNAEVKGLDIEEIFIVKLNARHQIKIFGKYALYDRNIPPTLYETQATENQKDEFILGKMAWQHQYLGLFTELSSAYVYQKINYSFSPTSSNALSFANAWQNHFKLRKKFKSNTTLYLKLAHQLETGNSANYKQIQQRNRWNINTSIAQKFSFFDASVGFNQLMVGNQFSPFLPNASFRLHIKNQPAKISLGLNYASKVRFPSLNDLYWTPGGNADLKVEKSQDIRFDFQLEKQLQRFTFYNKLEIYNVWAENYIQWQPTQYSYWQPINIGDVYSRGFSNHFDFSYRFTKKMKIKSALDFAHTRITRQNNTKQLIYVPYFSIDWSIGFSSKWINIGVNQHYTDQRFASADHSKRLSPFYLLDLHLSKAFRFKNKDNLQVNFSLKNILNQNYFYVINRPTPGINFLIGIQYKWNFKKS